MGMLPYWIRKVIGPSWGPYGGGGPTRSEVKGPGWTATMFVFYGAIEDYVTMLHSLV